MIGFKQSFIEDFLISSDGLVFNKKTGRRRKANKSKLGYTRIGFWDSGINKHRHVWIHRMVARAFVRGYRDGLVVNHKNGIKNDNRAENLEWITQGQNCSREKTISQSRWGSSHYASKLNEEKVVEMRKLNSRGHSINGISKKFGVCFRTAYFAIKGLTWKHVDAAS